MITQATNAEGCLIENDLKQQNNGELIRHFDEREQIVRIPMVGVCNRNAIGIDSGLSFIWEMNMNYTEFKKNAKDLTLKYQRERAKVNDMIQNVQKEHESGIISEHEAKEQEQKLYGILDTLKGKEKRSVERLKMNFARQDNPVDIGDIIWAQTKQGTKVMKVTEIRLAAFEYPMLKYFGIQLTQKGLPAKTQKVYPSGGIYQKDVTSVKGEAYTYKVRD